MESTIVNAVKKDEIPDMSDCEWFNDAGVHKRCDETEEMLEKIKGCFGMPINNTRIPQGIIFLLLDTKKLLYDTIFRQEKYLRKHKMATLFSCLCCFPTSPAVRRVKWLIQEEERILAEIDKVIRNVNYHQPS
jgi:hypothetical protein